MKQTAKNAIIIIVVALASFPCHLHSEVSPQAIDKAISAVKPALVRIEVVTVNHRGGREAKYEISGSGVIIDRRGFVVTNHHVAGKAKQVICTLSDKEKLPAEIVGTDPLTDICVLRLRFSGKKTFNAAEFGDSSRLRVGDYVLAMGSPYALSQSVTMGIVSNVEMVIPGLFWPFKFTVDGEDVGSILCWIGHDASIRGGSSGGPLVNLDGKIVGINEISIGLGGAIPGNVAKEVARQIIKYGKVRRGWLGLEIQPLLKSSDYKEGVLVSGMFPGSPAESAGFQSGDILLKLAGKRVNVRFPEEIPAFNQLVASLPVGRRARAVVIRDGRRQSLSVVVKERENVMMMPRELKEWGICASDLSFRAAREMERDTRDGVLVKSVRPGGPASEAKPEICSKDILVDVGSHPIKNLNGLLEVTAELLRDKSKPVPVVVTFDRAGVQYLTVVKVGIREMLDPGLEVSKAHLAIDSQVLTMDIADELGISGTTGVRVTRVYPGSSAEKSGIKKGDLIVALDGEIIPASEQEDSEVLPAMIRQYNVGSVVRLKILRADEELEIPAELATSPRLPREMKRYCDHNFEFTVRDVTSVDRVKKNWDEKKRGVLVEVVNEGGWAAIARLAVGDLVLTVDGKTVPDAAAMEKVMKGIAKIKVERVVFFVLRGIHYLYVELEPGWEGE